MLEDVKKVDSLKLKSLFWNINGRWRFLKDNQIVKWINNFEIIFISETNFTKGQIFEIPGYKVFHNSFSTVSDSFPRWGISCFIKQSIVQHIDQVNTDHENHIVITFKGGHKLFGSYIPPSDSIYFSDEYLYGIPNFLTPVDTDKIVIGGGDLNSRIGSYSIPPPSSGEYRDNPDSEKNSNGRQLSLILKSFHAYTLNNLTNMNKVFDGDFTFHKADRKSQNDIIICNLAGLNSCESLDIINIPFNFSDHKPVSVTFNLQIDIDNSFKSDFHGFI